MGKRLIYFDNAATSFPKPEEVTRAMVHFSNEIGASPGRSGHRLAIEAGRVVFEAREGIARLLGLKDSSRVVFGLNATEGINQGLKGLLRTGDHVITSSMEHNSVMRPLRAMMKEGLEVSIVPCSQEGFLDLSEVRKAIRPDTRMLVLNHASNVVGTLQPLAEIGEVCRQQGVLFFVDAAQSAGAIPIDMHREKIDLLAFTGHKALFGPQGTGGLVLGERVDEKELVPVKRGGTGSRSEQEEHPDFLPDLCESGTPNALGLAGLLAGLEFVMKVGIEEIRQQEKRLTAKLLQGLREIDGVKLYGPGTAEKQLATVSFNIQGMAPSEVGLRLDEDFGILCRVGLHCAPAAHRTLGTFPEGTVRFGLSYLNRAEEVEKALRAVQRIARGEA
ncbi:MAG: cysteine desulfurase [Deltaproteobacteria bacterium SM23_61]|nr:MAG: cysteine desulfurase [Deltaproteobacteria bacterium SM23_61]